MPYFTFIHPRVRISPVIEGTWLIKGYLTDGVISKMIEKLNERQIVVGSNLNQIRGGVQEVLYEIENFDWWGGVRKVEYGKVYIDVPLRRS